MVQRRLVVALVTALSIGAAGAYAYVRLKSRVPPKLAAAVQQLSTELSGLAAPDEVARVSAACESPRSPCDCAVAAARSGLDRNLGVSTLGVLDALEAPCRDLAPLAGMRSEALARVERFQEARHLAEVALHSSPDDPYANLALGLASFHDLSLKDTIGPTEKALKAGRGIEAHRLLGRVAVARSDWAQALEHFSAVVAGRPRDLEAAYTIAMSHSGLNRYNEARDGFMRVLSIDPRHVEARYHLAVMTLQVGARMEAEHHLQKLTEVAPTDPRIPALQAALSGSPTATTGTPSH
jgi:tetratricopeptide (TPR) repeat protein